MSGHELRNPPGTIDTSIETTSRLLGRLGELTTADCSTIDKSLQRVQRNVMRCSRITDELLGFTQQSGDHRQATELDSWLQDATNDYDLPAEIPQ
jgi:nitrogen fixation/metabolism regulation signal transduction histidine kinase